MAINIKITQEDIKNKITLREMLAAQNGDLNASVDILSRFLSTDDGAPIAKEAGKEMLLDLTLIELEGIVKTFYTSITDAAVPNQNAAS